jgi:signal transduction histidine kinase
VRQSARSTQNQAQQVLEEKRKLQDQLAVMLERAEQDRAQILGMNEMASAHTAAQDLIETLQAENEGLKAAIQQAGVSAKEGQQSVEGELRLALQEIALLKSTLDDTDRKMDELKAFQPGGALSKEQLEVITNIAQDLRQPLSSIAGYAEVLLGELVGILTNQQRKSLDRIKVSTERMSKAIEDLVQAASMEGAVSRLDLQEVDLNLVLNAAVAEYGAKMREKSINSVLEFPEPALHLTSDRHVLRKVFVSLLSNAVESTPAGGDLFLGAHLERTEGDRDYILIQVKDGGKGISPQDLPRVFSLRPPGDDIAGISKNGTDFPVIKSMVEALGGRIWVDSEPGQGATFSVLLPVSLEQLPELESGGNPA